MQNYEHYITFVYFLHQQNKRYTITLHNYGQNSQYLLLQQASIDNTVKATVYQESQPLQRQAIVFHAICTM